MSARRTPSSQPDGARRRALRTYVLLMRASEAVTRRAHAHLAAEGLSLSQFAVLEGLLHLGPNPQRVLAERILRSPSNLTTVVDHLEERGLVERRSSKEDRRVRLLHLTRSGRALIGRIFPPHAAGLRRELSALAGREQAELARLCRKLESGEQDTQPRPQP